MHELIPIACGFGLGALLGAFRISLLARALLVGALGACATIASGEFRLGWSFLLIDWAEVTLAAAAAVLLWRVARRRISKVRNSGF
jgi:hypothetical protein